MRPTSRRPRPQNGVGTAVQQRLGYFLGAGQPRMARSVATLCLCLQLGISWFVAGVMLGTRDELGRVFSSSEPVIRMTSAIVPLVAGAYCLIGLFYTSMAILNGQGRPLPVTVAYLLGAFAIAPSLGAVLTFVVGCCGDVKLYGLWLGLTGGYAVTTVIAWSAVLRSDWPAIAKRAQERAEVLPASADEQPPPPPGEAGAEEAACRPLPPAPPPGASGAAEQQHVQQQQVAPVRVVPVRQGRHAAATPLLSREQQAAAERTQHG